MCLGGCSGSGSNSGKGRQQKTALQGHRPLSYTKNLSMPITKPKVKFGSVKFGSRK